MPGKIKGITIKIGGDTKDMTSALKSMNAEIKKTDNELKTVNRLLKLNPGNVSLLKQKQSVLNTEITQTSSKLESMRQAQSQVTAEMRKQNPEQYRKLEREILSTENKLKGLQAQQKKVNYQLSEMGLKSAKLNALGDKLQGIGSKMRYASATTGAATAAAAKFAVDTEKNMAKVNSILGLSGKDWEKYEGQLKTGAKDIGKSYDEYADAAYQAISASVKQTKVTGFLKDASVLAKGGLTSLTSSVDLLTTVENAYNMSADKTKHISDILIQTQNRGKTTVDQLAASMGKVIPTARSAGVSFEQLGASYSIMTRNGVSTKIATTQLNSLIAELSKSGSKADIALRAGMGGSFKELMASGKNVGQVLQFLNEKAAGSGKSLQDMFGNVNAGKAAYTLLKEGAEGYNKELDSMMNSTGLAKKAADTMSNTTQAKLTKSINEAKNAAADFGAEVLPMITPLITKATDLVKEFSELDPTTKKLIVTGTAALALASPLTTSLGAVAKGTSKLMDLVGMLGTKEAATATKSGLLRSASSRLFGVLKANPYVLVAGAVGLATAATIKAIVGTNELTDAYEKNKAAREEAIRNSKLEAQTAGVYADQLDALMSKEKKSAADKELIRQYVSKLNKSVAGLNLKYDEEKDALNKSTAAIKERIAAMKDEAMASAYQAQMTAAAKEIAKNEMKFAEATKRHEAAKKKLEEAKKSYASRDEIGKLEGQVRKEKQAMDDASRAIARGKKEIENYGDAATKLGNKNTFNKLLSQAKISGKDVPKELAKGIESGKISVPKSVDRLKDLMKFYSLSQKAGIAGKDIPKALANGVSSGEITVKEATKRLNNWMSVKSAAKRAGIDASKIPKSIKKGILSDKVSVNKATKEIKNRVKKGVTVDLKKNGKNAAGSYAKGIASENTKGTAAKKAEEAKKGAGSKTFRPEGSKAGKSWKDAFAAVDFRGAGSKGAGQAKKGAGSVSLRSEGADAAQGYANGVKSKNGILWNAGAWIFNTLKAGLKSKKGQNSNSPAKNAVPLGEDASTGYAQGVQSKSKLLEKTGQGMAGSLLSGVGKTDISVGYANTSQNRIGKSMANSPTLNLRTETGSIGNDIANIMMIAMKQMQTSANSQAVPQEARVVLYMYPNGPKCGEATVNLYDTYKKRIG